VKRIKKCETKKEIIYSAGGFAAKKYESSQGMILHQLITTKKKAKKYKKFSSENAKIISV